MALATTFRCVSGEGLAERREALWEAGQVNRDNLLKYLRPLLKNVGGRLYYNTQCWPKEAGDDFSYPQLELEAPQQHQTILDAVRGVFVKSKEVLITEERDGIIRIRIGDVSGHLLDTKLDVLKLKPRERYNAPETLIAIFRTAEVRSKMKQLGIVAPPTIVNEHLVEPAPGLPHLPDSMSKITVDEAVDQVARTFKCLVVYGECTRADGTHLISMEYVDVAGIEAFIKRK